MSYRMTHANIHEIKKLRKAVFMRDEYDFSKGERGGFYRPDARVHLPLYLDDDVQTTLISLAAATGKDYSELANSLLRKIINKEENLL